MEAPQMAEADVCLIAGTYSRLEGGVVVELYGRSMDGASVLVRAGGFRPYFVLVEPPDDVRGILEADDEVVGFRPLTLEVDGKDRSCLQVFIHFPFKVPNYRSQFQPRCQVLAADIPYVYRFLFDHDLGSCVHAQGLDRADLVGMPYRVDRVIDVWARNPEELGGSLLADKTDDAWTFAFRAQGGEGSVLEGQDLGALLGRLRAESSLSSTEPFKPPLTVLSFDIENSIKKGNILCISVIVRKGGELVKLPVIHGDEKDILLEFQRVVAEQDPDVITGYNIDGYDLPYIERRAGELRMGPLMLGRDMSAPRRVNNQFWRLTGRVVADAWWNVKRELRPKQESLNYVSRKLLNREKLDVDPSRMDEEWAENPERVMEYCALDSELALLVLEEIKVLRKNLDMGVVAKLPLDDTINGRTSNLIDSIMIRRADRHGIGVPLTRHESRTGQIEGGYVHEVEPGLYHWVCVLDFRSMYPSVIIANNICFTTIDPEGGEIVSPLGVRFASPERKKGILPEILSELMGSRAKFKANMKEARAKGDDDTYAYYDGLQEAVKILMNSFYGVFASYFYRFTNRDIGASITAYSRENIKGIIRQLGSEGLDVIYSDTDSVFFRSPHDELEATVKFGTRIAERFSEGSAVLEFEKVLEPFFTHGAKKRYIGHIVWPEEGKIVRGYETRRTDSFDLQSSVLEEVFDIVLDGSLSEEERRDRIVKRSRELIEKTMAGEVDPTRLVISRSVQEESAYVNPESMANVRAMRKMIALGYEFTPGMKVSYVVVNSRAKPQDVEPYIDGRPFEHTPDWRYYAGRLAMSLSRITEGFGWGEKSLLTGSRQGTLFDGGFGSDDDEAAPEPGDGEWGSDDIDGDAGLTKGEARVEDRKKAGEKKEMKGTLDDFM